MRRRDFLAGMFSLLATTGATAGMSTHADELPRAPPIYQGVTHEPIEWTTVSAGLEFSRTRVLQQGTHIDTIATVRINPERNRIRVFNCFDANAPLDSPVKTIERWQEETGALAMINSAQYMADPYYNPVALVLQEGKPLGPKVNKSVRGMLVAEPKNRELPLADLLDFEYDSFDVNTTPYTEGVQHWPILLDRNGRVKVKKTDWQANRTIVSKDKEGNIMFMTTEGGYFTLFNLGHFLKDSNKRQDEGFRVHTAMNMDGGYEANMVVKTPSLEYVTYGEHETYGVDDDASIFNIKIPIPGVVGVFPRD